MSNPEWRELRSTRKSQLTKLSMKDKSIYYFIHNASRHERPVEGIIPPELFAMELIVGFSKGYRNMLLQVDMTDSFALWNLMLGNRQQTAGWWLFSTQLWTRFRHIYIHDSTGSVRSEKRLNVTPASSLVKFVEMV